MNILALIGSPRKNGNTVAAVDTLLSGAKDAGHETDRIMVYDQNILPCIDCRRCQRVPFACCLRDDMGMLYEKISGADVLVIGTPLYWYGASAPMKTCIDRFRPYVSSRELEGKGAIVIVPSEEGSSACDPLMHMFRLSFQYLGVQLLDSLLIKAYDRDDARQSPGILERAYALGAEL